MKKRVVLGLIIIALLFLSGYEMFKGNIKLNNVKNDSVVENIYYCDDSIYFLDNHNCIKYDANNKVVLGDVNLDGVIDISDVNYINNYINKTIDLNKFQMAAADVNKDSLVDTLDISLIQERLLQSEEKQYVCAIDYELVDELCLKQVSMAANYKEHIKGDITLDDKVNNDDVLVLLNYLTNRTYISELAYKMADTNDDNILDKKDLNNIKKKIDEPLVSTYELDKYKKIFVESDIIIYAKENIQKQNAVNATIIQELVFETKNKYYYKIFNSSSSNIVESSVCKVVDNFVNNFEVTVTSNNDYIVINFYTDSDCANLKTTYQTKLEVKQ